MSRSDKIGLSRLEDKEDFYWEFIYVDHHILPILHNQINLRNNVLHNLLDYENNKIEKIC